MTEAVLIALIGGFISIISVLVKYRLDTNKNTKEIRELVENIRDNDKKQNEHIRDINNNISIVSSDVKKVNQDLNSFIYNSQLNDKINRKYMAMQIELNKVVVKDIQHQEHNGDLIKAEQQIKDFDKIVNDNDFFKG